MERTRRTVKQERRYDSSGRRRQAQEKRETIVEVARRRFIEGGFASTTVAAIADESGVSVETIYKGFGGKAGLVRAIWNRALEGAGPIPAEARSDALHAATRDAYQILRGWGRLMMEVAPRAAPVLLLLRDAAATDPAMAELLTQLEEERLSRMTHNARLLADGGHLRDGLSMEDAGVVLWVYSSPELFERLVLKTGWSPERFGEFISTAIAAALLPIGGLTPRW